MVLKLVREKEVNERDKTVQTLGWLYVYKEGELVKSFATLELAWDDNRTGISCIPPKLGDEKEYDIVLLDSSPAFNYPHYWVKDVPNRTGIKIHIGNYYTQIEGCILVGKEHKYDINGDGLVDVTHSKDSLEELIELVGSEAKLTIKYPDQRASSDTSQENLVQSNINFGQTFLSFLLRKATQYFR